MAITATDRPARTSRCNEGGGGAEGMMIERRGEKKTIECRYSIFYVIKLLSLIAASLTYNQLFH